MPVEWTRLSTLCEIIVVDVWDIWTQLLATHSAPTDIFQECAFIHSFLRLLISQYYVNDVRSSFAGLLASLIVVPARVCGGVSFIFCVCLFFSVAIEMFSMNKVDNIIS